MNDYYDKLATEVKHTLEALEAPNLPEGAVCFHLGTTFNIDNDTVGIRTKGDDLLLVTVYRGTNKYVSEGYTLVEGEIVECDDGSILKSYVGYTKARHDKVIETLEKAVGKPISTTWNGEEDNDGVSVLFAANAPKNLVEGISNYRALNDVFDREANAPFYKLFDDWLDASKKRVSEKYSS